MNNYAIGKNKEIVKKHAQGMFYMQWVKPDKDKKDMYGQEYRFSPAFACIQAVC